MERDWKRRTRNSNLRRSGGFKKGRGERARTEVVGDDAAFGEAAGGAVVVEVAAVGPAVGVGEGAEVAVGVDGGVAEDEEHRGREGSPGT